MINKSRFFKAISSGFVLPAVTAAAITVFSVFPAFSGDAAADYMFVLKDGSNIMGSVGSEDALEDAAVSAIKIKTAFGEVSIPREQIAKYFKQSAKKDEPAKTQEEVKKPEVKQEALENAKKAEVKSEHDTNLRSKAEITDKKTEDAKTGEDAKSEAKDKAEKAKTDIIDKKSEDAKISQDTKKPEIKAEHDAAVKAEDKKTDGTEAAKSQPLPEKEVNKNDGKAPLDEMSILESTPEEVTKGDDPALRSPAKPDKSADAVLNMDDDKLIDMLGESKVEAPKPAMETSIEGTSEIDSIKAKYQYKKSETKELVPKNLNSLTDDVKLIAASRTEEAMLLGGAKDVKAKLADTAPVEVITVGDKKAAKGEDGDAKKNKKKKKGAKDKKGGDQTGEVSIGTGEVGLTTAEIMITDETEEVKKLGGGNLSENIVKQFKKHKAYPADSVEGKKHLEDEINKHFKKDEPKPAEETEEVKTEKADKKDKKK